MREIVHNDSLVNIPAQKAVYFSFLGIKSEKRAPIVSAIDMVFGIIMPLKTIVGDSLIYLIIMPKISPVATINGLKWSDWRRSALPWLRWAKKSGDPREKLLNKR